MLDSKLWDKLTIFNAIENMGGEAYDDTAVKQDIAQNKADITQNKQDIVDIGAKVDELESDVADVSTLANSVQSQLDNLVLNNSGSSDVAPEVIQARADSDGTTHTTLKTRLDADQTALKTDILSVNVKSVNYKGSLDIEDSIDSTELETGVYYVASSSSGTKPESDAVYLLTVTGQLPYLEQSAINLVSGKQFVRCYNNGWKSWKETTVTSFPFYKRSLTADDNIDNVVTEGVYFLQNANKPQGNFSDINFQYALLEVKGVGTNYISQTISSLASAGKVPTVKCTRTKTTTWSDWKSEWVDETAIEENIINKVGKSIEDITGYEKPNILKNELSTTTNNGITYTVNDDKSITVNGTATELSYVGINVTLPEGNYILTGSPEGATTQSYHILTAPNTTSLYELGKGCHIELTEQKTFKVYIRVMKNTVVDNKTFYPMIRDASVTNSTYVPYGVYQIYKPIQKLIDYTEHNWSGKKLNVIGDSIVQGSYGNFVNVIGDILNLSVVRNYGIGGSLIASSDVDSTLPPACTRYVDMDDDADIIIVHAGTNDFSAQIPLGDEKSNDITTFNGALNVLMDGLREKYPDKLIIFDNILHRYNDNANDIKVSQYRECIEKRCLANHIVFYDSYKYTGFNFVKGYYDHILTTDGLHPNQRGADILGRKLAGFIRWN